MSAKRAPDSAMTDEISCQKGLSKIDAELEPARKKLKTGSLASLKQYTLEQSVAKVTGENLCKQLELVLVKLICIHGMVLTLIDTSA